MTAQGRRALPDIEAKAHHRRHRRAGAHAAGARARWQADLDLQGGDGADELSQISADCRLWRDRHRVRELLSQLGAEVDGGRATAPHPPAEDAEISEFARKAFIRQGIAIHTGTRVERLAKGGDSVTATLRKQDGAIAEVAADRVILAIGITGNVEGLGLEQQGVGIDKGHIVVDEWCRTGAAGLYAIGDVVGPPWLAHKASHEGIICVEKICRRRRRSSARQDRHPGCTYSAPQIASVGLTEEAAREGGRALKIGRFPYSANGKAIALGETEGMVKTIFDAESGALLGAHLIGAEATELIQGFAIAKTLETTEAELMAAIFPHPTLSEMMGESVLDAYGRALHI